jgi:hypothetical protein
VIRLLVLAVLIYLIYAVCMATAHSAGQYPPGAKHDWFDSLKSGHGYCCSFADGRSVATDNWGTEGDHYWVIVDNKKFILSPDEIVTQPNTFGEAVVWPYNDPADGLEKIRCFLPGAGT